VALGPGLGLGLGLASLFACFQGPHFGVFRGRIGGGLFCDTAVAAAIVKMGGPLASSTSESMVLVYVAAGGRIDGIDSAGASRRGGNCVSRDCPRDFIRPDEDDC
jgi:hypothetical protein